MSYVYYRSSNDGWRVGRADAFHNVTTVEVTDSLSGLVEHVRPSEVFLPKDAKKKLMADPQAAPAAAPTAGGGEQQQQADASTQGKPQEEILVTTDSALLHMYEHPEEYLDKEDVTRMKPAPTELPPLVHNLRYRFHNQKDTTFLGDNFAVHLRRGVLKGSDGSGVGLATRAVASLTASQGTVPQLITAFGDGTFGVCSDAALSAASQLGASEAEVQRLRAAHTILQVFTHGVDGSQKVLRRVSICKAPDGTKSRAPSSEAVSPTTAAGGGGGDDNKSVASTASGAASGGGAASQGQQGFAASGENAAPVYGFSQFDYSFFDTEHVVKCPESNFLIMAFCIYAFDNEEKERCYISKRSKSFLAVNEITNPEELSMLRERYFSFSKAMEAIGFEVNVLLTICARVAAVLHLLNIEFGEDGTALTLASMKGAARLIQTDFGSLQQALTSKELCQQAAKTLYASTFQYLLRKVNELLNPKGWNNESALLTVLGLPQKVLPAPGFTADLRSLLVNTMYEDVHQAFYRSSDTEIVQWQEQGFVVPAELSLVFDHVDNYAILKALKAKGGALRILLSDPDGKDMESVITQLRSLGKYRCCSFDEQGCTLTINHSFGPVDYQIPRNDKEWAASNRSLFHENYVELRDHLVQNTDVETQEALVLLEQEEEDRRNPNIVNQLHLDLTRTFFDLVSDVKQHTWWASVMMPCAGVNSTTVADQVKFHGAHIAQELTSNLGHAVLELRRLLPSRFIPVRFPYIASEFKDLLPASYIKAADPEIDQRHRAEAICASTHTPHVVGKSILLLQASAIADLRDHQHEHRSRAATLIQGQMRGLFAAIAVNRRVTRWTDAVNKIDGSQNEIERIYRWQTEHAERHHVQRLGLQEDEVRARAGVNDTYWVEWVSLETAHCMELERVVQNAVASALAAENALAMRSIDDSHRLAVKEINQRVKSRLIQQGARLDKVTRDQIAAGNCQKQALERVEDAHDRILRTRMAQEEAKAELDRKLRQKGQRYKGVIVDRERQRETLRNKLWLRQERDHAVRDHMERNREQVAMYMQQSMDMDNVERQLSKRLAQEVRDRQRSEREEHKAKLAQQRAAKEKKLEIQQRMYEQRRLQDEKRLAKTEEKEFKQKLREGHRLATLQTRERIATEKAKKEDLERQKILTRTLLKAHNMMLDPALYEQTSKGAKVLPETSRARSASRGLAEGFSMSSGKTTYPHLLDEDTWKGLSSYHGTGIAAETARSRSRHRAASPSKSEMSL